MLKKMNKKIKMNKKRNKKREMNKREMMMKKVMQKSHSNHLAGEVASRRTTVVERHAVADANSLAAVHLSSPV